MKTLVVGIIFIWGIFIGAALGGFLIPQEKTLAPPLILSEPSKERFPRIIVPVPVNYTNLSTASVIVPAVNQDGEGVATTLTAQLIPGSGRSLANIDNILFLIDTQNSIRTAKNVAQDITGIDLKNFDTVYTIEAQASVIEGPSAGAAITVATVAVIEKRGLNKDVMITGTVNEQGFIGPVGGIGAKAKAAKEIGAKLFLVPENQGSSVTYETRRYCQVVGGSEVCTVEQMPVETDISSEVGIEVREVKTVEEALKYFFN